MNATKIANLFCKYNVKYNFKKFLNGTPTAQCVFFRYLIFFFKKKHNLNIRLHHHHQNLNKTVMNRTAVYLGHICTWEKDRALRETVMLLFAVQNAILTSPAVNVDQTPTCCCCSQRHLSPPAATSATSDTQAWALDFHLIPTLSSPDTLRKTAFLIWANTLAYCP